MNYPSTTQGSQADFSHRDARPVSGSFRERPLWGVSGREAGRGRHPPRGVFVFMKDCFYQVTLGDIFSGTVTSVFLPRS